MSTPRIRLNFGKRLKALRKIKNLTQEGIAEKAGIDMRYYQRLESNNPSAIKIDTIGKLAKALKVHPSNLLR